MNLHGVGDLRLDEVARPVPGAGEVLLRVRACGICGSDIPRVFSKGTYHFPTIIGHEFAGEIVEAGDEYGQGLIGSGAAVFPLLPCGECEACREERYAQCSHYDYYGSRRDGAMAEYLAVRRENLVLMPGGVSYAEAAMSEPAAVAVHAFRKAKVGPGDTLAIFGVGPIALIMAGWARDAGVQHIILVARSEEKVRFAQRLGFPEIINGQRMDVNEYIRRRTGGEGADACIEGTGGSEGLEACALCTKNFGRIVTLANPLGEMRLSQTAYWQILRRELKVVGTWNSSFAKSENDWQEVMAAMRDKVIDVASLITHRFRLEDYQEAFRLMHEKREMYCKVMFEMGDAADE